MKRSNADKADLFMDYWRMLVSDVELSPVPEYHFSKVVGRKHRFDWAWPKYRIGVEVDGGGWLPHGGRHGSDVDREKLNIAASLRWLVFRFSPAMLRQSPMECVNMVLQAIKDSE